MVKYKLLKYEAGEIAHIENIIKGEVKTVSSRKLVNNRETITSTKENKKALKNTKPQKQKNH